MTTTLSLHKTRWLAALSALIVIVLVFPALWASRAAAQTGTFSFTAEGDIGGNSNSSASLQQVANAGGVFSLAVGDLGYVSTGGETNWCNFVKNIVGSTFPFELVAGNHEDDNRANGFIGNYAACLPDRMGSTGAYGAEYYFDYNNARIIMAAAASSVNGISYSYNTVGSTRYNWMQARIQEAKAAGKWVIVGVHKNCITPGTKSCELGQNFVNLVHTEGVDLFLQGHDHIYARSKQLTCATANTYNSACVVDSDDSYVRGAGTVTLISGVTGQSQYNINASDIERNYFVKAMGGNGNWNWVTGATNSGRGYGVTKITVAANQIDVTWLTSVTSVAGWGGDSFSIVGAGGPTSTPGPTNTPTFTNTPVATATPTNTPAPGTVMHVEDVLTTDVNGNPQSTFIKGSTVYWRVKIVDANNAVVSGAAVTTQALKPGGSSWTTLTVTTDANGWALFSKKSNGNSPLGTYTINVTNVTKSGATYNPSANVKSSTTFVLQ